jgi:pimeloyl-ACP methyl ester carboxylesterase/DNA-binding CsgD family transcriptional regulator
MDAPPVQYATTSDGYNIAYAVRGEGEPYVLMPQLFSHLQIYWTQQTFVLPWLQGLASKFRLVQYDGRGQGMSGRGIDPDMSLKTLTRDLEAVVDRLRLEHFVLHGLHWFTHVAVEYAIAHPERVKALVLSGATASNRAWSLAIYDTLAREDWQAFLRSQAALGQASDVQASLERLGQSITQTDWLALVGAAAESDISDRLPLVRVPTLVIQPRHFFNLPAEASMQVAAAIPNARLVVVDGAVVLGDAEQGLRALEAFLSGLELGQPDDAGAPSAGVQVGLSGREIDVLRLLAAGRSNAQIADELVISQNTVIRHVSNIFAKIGAENRAQAAVYARDHGIG